ncbi:NAD(P)-dependent alcohol dehydrogenase [Halarcobacter anaerophilus]|uniref:Zn-dependent alcohol dehydrogenase n=1 Tax=Halarcobacter anaerophilus TaxID=877500 RepID=A0A4Q0Y4S3_9BACT|nr:NAD(P)-dependent alcohol dehydrogenase [Halarcobacter anaerophilus]QDF29599.1 zinc-dependent alcohol dehydrogenase [Halarcobacter anaerophilus]RXJ64833.1 Zn-dependent alcohol dehydrogenase [Halarcobacter anaerophilus]
MNGKTQTRRDFIKNSAIIGAGLVFYKPTDILANDKGIIMNKNLKVKGYAAFDESGVIKPWEFERRPVGDNDVLIEIKYASICHSDIHQEKGDWGKQQYPQVPGHEIVGIVTKVGKNVTKFKVGDRAGVGCMVDGCTECENEEQYQPDTLFTYGYPDKRDPTGITQGGYSTHIVVRDHFVVHIPENISFQEAAPLLCAGITTYSPLMKAKFKKGDKVGVAGIGGLGHMAVKLAASMGAEVYAFTTSADKKDDILGFGAKEVIVVDSSEKLAPYAKTLDYMISTIPAQFDVAAYAATVKPYGFFTQVGMPKGFELTLSNIGFAANRVNFNASLIGGMKETQEVVDYCAKNKIYPQIEIIDAEEITQAWQNVIDKKARYRYVIDSATI